MGSIRFRFYGDMGLVRLNLGFCVIITVQVLLVWFSSQWVQVLIFNSIHKLPGLYFITSQWTSTWQQLGVPHPKWREKIDAYFFQQSVSEVGHLLYNIIIVYLLKLLSPSQSANTQCNPLFTLHVIHIQSPNYQSTLNDYGSQKARLI